VTDGARPSGACVLAPTCQTLPTCVTFHLIRAFEIQTVVLAGHLCKLAAVTNRPGPLRRIRRTAYLPHTGDCYFITAPTFETKSERDGWLNGVEAVGKMQSTKCWK
jgi:hypothetical protein